MRPKGEEHQMKGFSGIMADAQEKLNNSKSFFLKSYLLENFDLKVDHQN